MLIVLALAGIVLALAAGYVWGRRTGSPAAAALQEAATAPPAAGPSPAAVSARTAVPPRAAVPPDAAAAPPSTAPVAPAEDGLAAERARLVRSLEAETASLRALTRAAAAEIAQLASLAEERRGLFGTLAESRAETARWRDVAVAVEDNAAPPLLGGPGAPDDLKLIVGIGPVLERVLHQLGVTSYRQIARWSERDIETVDLKLAEFRGRIRRDGWVTQARALHQSFHGEAP